MRRQRWLRFGVCALVGMTLLLTTGSVAGGISSLQWAFPTQGPAAQATPVPGFRTLRGSSVRYTQADLDSGFLAIDWRPATHPRLPAVVGVGRQPDVLACGYCHLPDGAGRPENAALAGLPAKYLVDQVHAMRSGTRNGVHPAWPPTALMTQVAHAVTVAEVTSAAAYFSQRPFVAHTRVVEAVAIPAVAPDAFAYRRSPGRGRAMLGRRIIELPDDFDRFELRDSTVDYIAYAPPGSVARGRLLAATGDQGRVPACMTCHGSGLRGSTDVPPLAGRSPSQLFRQLEGFRAGSRRAAPMRAEVADLSTSEMIDLAAYAASLKP